MMKYICIIQVPTGLIFEDPLFVIFTAPGVITHLPAWIHYWTFFLWSFIQFKRDILINFPIFFLCKITQNEWPIYTEYLDSIQQFFDIHLCTQHNISTLLSQNCSLRCNQLDLLTTNYLKNFAENVIVKITVV